MDEVYDVPLSYRRAAENPGEIFFKQYIAFKFLVMPKQKHYFLIKYISESAESDYDVPCSLLRRMSDHTSGKSDWYYCHFWLFFYVNRMIYLARPHVHGLLILFV